MSNAFFRSIKTPTVASWLSSELVISSTSSIIAVANRCYYGQVLVILDEQYSSDDIRPHMEKDITSEDRCQHTHRCQNTVAGCRLKEIRTRHLDMS